MTITKLYNANAVVTAKKDGSKKGETKTRCKKPLSKISVTVVRTGPSRPKDNFHNNIWINQGKINFASDQEECEKATGDIIVKPGLYEVSAGPKQPGMGYSLKEIVKVSVNAGERKAVTVELIPNEIIKVLPYTKKVINQYVNLKNPRASSSPNPRWGNEVEITAVLKRPEENIKVYWEIEPGTDNGKYEGQVINGLDHQPSFSDGSKGVNFSLTNTKGEATIKIKLGWFGGNTYRVLAALSKKPSHPGAKAKKSDEFRVWRKGYYQISAYDQIAIPSRALAEASFKKVFLETEEYAPKTYAEDDAAIDPNTDHFRESWQFEPGSGTDKKLCVGTHNIDVFKGLYTPPAGNKEPKAHVINCHYQCDAKDVSTDVIYHNFTNGNPLQEKKDFTIAGTSSSLVCIFDPPIQGGSLILWAKYIQGTWDTTTSSWTKTSWLPLPENCVVVDSGRGSKREVVIKAPPAAIIDPTHYVRVGVELKAAKGTYLGWAEDPHHIVVVDGMTKEAFTNVLNHELGHLFGQTPTAKTPKPPPPTVPPSPPAPPAYVDERNKIPVHPKMYQQRGGSGTHCADGATWHADLGAAPQLNPDNQNELDASNHGSGRYSGGTCIMFGTCDPSTTTKREFCEHCAMQIKARSLKSFA